MSAPRHGARARARRSRQDWRTDRLFATWRPPRFGTARNEILAWPKATRHGIASRNGASASLAALRQCIGAALRVMRRSRLLHINPSHNQKTGGWHGACGSFLEHPRRAQAMYSETIEGFSKAAEKKLTSMRKHPGGFFVSSMLAGAYVGVGILLIFTLGTQVPKEFQKLVMGATFGIALTLVAIAGSELFTGHTMFMALRRFNGAGTLADIASSWGMTWAE